jgi:DNA-binding ferritin-like protein (Dps family)
LLNRLWGKTKNRRIRLRGHMRNLAFVARYLFEMRRYRNALIDIEAIESILKSIFPKAHIVGDKTPDYLLSLDRLVLNNGLNCLIIFRDCRDVTSSVLVQIRTKWRKKHWKHNFDTAEKIAERWVRRIEIMERNKGKIHIVRYEDLVLEPRQELDKLAEWLGIDAAGFSDNLISNIRKTSIGKYKTGLTKEELDTVMSIASPTMARLGYI